MRRRGDGGTGVGLVRRPGEEPRAASHEAAEWRTPRQAKQRMAGMKIPQSMGFSVDDVPEC